MYTSIDFSIKLMIDCVVDRYHNRICCVLNAERAVADFDREVSMCNKKSKWSSLEALNLIEKWKGREGMKGELMRLSSSTGFQAIMIFGRCCQLCSGAQEGWSMSGCIPFMCSISLGLFVRYIFSPQGKVVVIRHCVSQYLYPP